MSGEGGGAEVSNQEGGGAFGEYVVYVDESGDPNPLSVSAEYPIFVLAFCIFKVSDYVNQVVPAMHALKFKYFGHDGVIFHERDIRKSDGVFRQIVQGSRRDEFFEDLKLFVSDAKFKLISVIVEKKKLNVMEKAEDLYLKAFSSGIKEVERFLVSVGSKNCTVVVIESRGKNEDRILLKQLANEANKPTSATRSQSLAFQPLSKVGNNPGLQIADLVARPLGNYVLNNQQRSRAVDAVWPKLNVDSRGNVFERGLIVLPNAKSP